MVTNSGGWIVLVHPRFPAEGERFVFPPSRDFPLKHIGLMAISSNPLYAGYLEMNFDHPPSDEEARPARAEREP